MITFFLCMQHSAQLSWHESIIKLLRTGNSVFLVGGHFLQSFWDLAPKFKQMEMKTEKVWINFKFLCVNILFLPDRAGRQVENFVAVLRNFGKKLCDFSLGPGVDAWQHGNIFIWNYPQTVPADDNNK